MGGGGGGGSDVVNFHSTIERVRPDPVVDALRNTEGWVADPLGALASILPEGQHGQSFDHWDGTSIRKLFKVVLGDPEIVNGIVSQMSFPELAEHAGSASMASMLHTYASLSSEGGVQNA